MYPLVTATWLAENLQSTDLIVLDASLPPIGVKPVPDMMGAYLRAHIPGALFFDIDELSDTSSGLPHTLPTADSFAAGMGSMGLHEGMTVVVYEQGIMFSAPRARWMLRTFGVANVLLLQGGLQAWLAAGYPVQAGPVQRDATDFHATLNENAPRNFAQLQKVLAGKGQVLDARSAGRFSGADPEPRAGLSSGHMPGATSVPFNSLTNGAAMKSPDELRAIFAAKHVDLSAPIVTTCGSGVTAAVVSLGLELAGATDVALYDGSWAEYAQKPEAVIIKDV